MTAPVSMQEHLAAARASRDAKWEAAGLDRQEIYRAMAAKRWGNKKPARSSHTGAGKKPNQGTVTI